MKCLECEIKISAYLDKELSSTEEKEIITHLKNCQKCYNEFLILEKLHLNLNNLPRYEINDSIIEKIYANTSQKNHLKNKWIYIPIAASILFSIWLGSYTGNSFFYDEDIIQKSYSFNNIFYGEI